MEAPNLSPNPPWQDPTPPGTLAPRGPAAPDFAGMRVRIENVVRRCACGNHGSGLVLANVVLDFPNRDFTMRVGWELCVPCANALAEAVRTGRFQPLAPPEPPR